MTHPSDLPAEDLAISSGLRTRSSVGPPTPPATFRALQPEHVVFGRIVERCGSSAKLSEALGDGIRLR